MSLARFHSRANHPVVCYQYGIIFHRNCSVLMKRILQSTYRCVWLIDCYGGLGPLWLELWVPLCQLGSEVGQGLCRGPVLWGEGNVVGVGDGDVEDIGRRRPVTASAVPWRSPPRRLVSTVTWRLVDWPGPLDTASNRGGPRGRATVSVVSAAVLGSI